MGIKIKKDDFELEIEGNIFKTTQTGFELEPGIAKAIDDITEKFNPNTNLIEKKLS